jgi:hypothetical protein
MVDLEQIADSAPAEEDKQLIVQDELDSLIAEHGEVAVLRAILASELGPKLETHLKTPWQAIRWILARIIDSKHPRFEAEAMAIAARMDYLGMTCADLGRKYGLTRAMANLRVVEFRNQLGIPHERKDKQ